MEVVPDTGVILSFLEGKFREYYNKILDQEVTAYVSVVNLAELRYVLCRKLGSERAEKIVKGITKSGYYEIVGVKTQNLKICLGIQV